MVPSPKVRKFDKKVLQLERKGSVVRRSSIPKSWNMQNKIVIETRSYPESVTVTVTVIKHMSWCR